MIFLNFKTVNLADTNSFFTNRLVNTFDFEGNYAKRTPATQGGFQAAGLCVALAFGIVGGAIVGERPKHFF